MEGGLTNLCGELMKGLKEHKETTGEDPWPAVKGEVGIAEEKGENLDELLDSFDDMIDELMGDTGGGAAPAPQHPRTRKDDETLEDLVSQAMRQLREVGLPQPKDDATQAVQVHDLDLPASTLDELDALADCL